MKRYTKRDLSKAQADYDLARARLMTIKESVDELEFAPKRRALIGKCFRCRNNYSCPTGESDYWWMWAKVVGVDGAMLELATAQIDKYGKATIEMESVPSFDGQMMTGYQPVSLRQHARAIRDILDRAAKTVGRS